MISLLLLFFILFFQIVFHLAFAFMNLNGYLSGGKNIGGALLPQSTRQLSHIFVCECLKICLSAGTLNKFSFYQSCIKEPAKYLWWRFLLLAVNYFRKTLHWRCFPRSQIRLKLLLLRNSNTFCMLQKCCWCSKC